MNHSGLQQFGFPELVVVCTVAVLLFWGGRIPALTLRLREAFNRFRGGGPGSPSHPILANDSRILNRKHRKTGKTN